MLIIDCLFYVCFFVLFNIFLILDFVNVFLICRIFYKILVFIKRLFMFFDFWCFERRMIYIFNKGIWFNIIYVKFFSFRFCVKVSNFVLLKDMVWLISLDIYCMNISGEEFCEFILMGLIGINFGYCEWLIFFKLF